MPFFVDAFPVFPATEQKRQTWYNGAKLPREKRGYGLAHGVWECCAQMMGKTKT